MALYSALLPEISAQKVKLKGLNQALKLTKGFIADMYTNHIYAFAMVHIYESIYQEKVLTTKGKSIKTKVYEAAFPHPQLPLL